jgi:hypothetical protein
MRTPPPMTLPDPPHIVAGAPVYGAEGDRFGEVDRVEPHYFVIRKGLLFRHDLHLPMSTVGGVDDDGVHLALTKWEVDERDWSDPPDPMPVDQPPG